MKPIIILLVEDNEGDILLTKEAFTDGKILNEIKVVKNGEDAISTLKELASAGNPSLPGLILLDINLPRKNGQEVLKFVKQSADLKHIPVIMLTTSCAEKDICESYNNKANFYITKPVEVNKVLEVISKIDAFGYSIVSLP